MDRGAIIRECRRNLGDPPRKFSREAQLNFRLRLSWHLRFVFWLSQDRLRIIMRDQELLRDRGRVVWGCLVQANHNLFQPTNRQTLPANVIYSLDAYFDEQTLLLLQVAQRLFNLKGTSPEDQAVARFAAAITNELARTMRLALPPSLSLGEQAFLTTCLIQPSHLPTGYLVSGLFPLLICPEETEAVMILPARYWPDALVQSWNNPT